MHKAARQAAKAVLVAERQDKYSEMSKILFKNMKKLNNRSIREYAQEIGLDMKRYDKEINSPDIRKIVEQDTALARRIKVRSVPSIYINGKKAKNRTLVGLEKMIMEE